MVIGKRVPPEFLKWLAVLVTLAQCIAGLYLWLWRHDHTSAAFFGGLGLGLLILGVLYLRLGPERNPIDRRLSIDFDAPHHTNVGMPIGVITKNPDGSKKATTVRMAWATFLDGMEQLVEHMNGIPPWYHIGACIGVNTGGLVFADYVSRKYRTHIERGHLDVIMSYTLGQASKDPQEPAAAPNGGPGEISNILVVDSQVKSGRTMKMVCRHIKQKYNCEKIWYLALIACVDPEDPNRTDVRGHIQQISEDASADGCEVFCWIAFATSKKTVKLPAEVY